jgi:hypothetical protein
MPLKLPNFIREAVLIDKQGRPTRMFHQWWQEVLKRIQTAFADLEAIVLAVQAAQDAAAAATAAAELAQTAADDAATAATTAQASADTAQDSATAIAEGSALSNSYVSGLTVTATDAGPNAVISLSAHTRHYPQPDGSTVNVAVNGGAVTGLAYNTFYYVYYDDAARAGGAVVYVSTTSDATAAQLGDRHLVGSATTPAAAAPPNIGWTVKGPGVGDLYE